MLFKRTEIGDIGPVEAGLEQVVGELPVRAVGCDKSPAAEWAHVA